jgi:hypothetical protein
MMNEQAVTRPLAFFWAENMVLLPGNGSMGFMKHFNRNMTIFLLLVFFSINACSSSSTLQIELVIEYQRSGGYAGVNESYSLFSDGRINVINADGWQVDAKRVDALVKRLAELGFYDLASAYIPKNACCDRFSHQLTVKYGNNTHTVSAVGGDPRVPENFWEILKVVQAFLDNKDGTVQN